MKIRTILKTFLVNYILVVTLTAPAAMAGVVNNQKINLNGKWEVRICEEKPDSYESTVPVPGIITQAKPSLGDNLDELDDEVTYNTVWYRRNFTLGNEDFSKAILKLRARYNVEVFINGESVGYDIHSSYSFASFDITQALKKNSSNEIVLKVGSWNTASIASKENKAEWWRSTRAPGIWDDVTIDLHGSVSISAARIQPYTKEQKVVVYADINSDSKDKELSVQFSIMDGGKRICSKTVNYTPANGEALKVELPANKLTCWSPGKEGNPKLYHINICVNSRDGSALAEENFRFGYRSIEIKGRDVLLNGEKIIFRADNIAFVRALNRWADVMFDEAWLRKFIHAAVHDYNYNYLRIHLGHAYSRFYDIADEEGLMIDDEWRFMHDDDPQGADLECTSTEFKRWISDNYNHPSIVAWDQENEGNVRVESLIRELRDYDPTRLWSEEDFCAKHIYQYSEREVPDMESTFVAKDKPFTIMEACRIWANEFVLLEKREAFKTSRTASGWNLMYFTPEDVERLITDLHTDIGTFYRKQRVQAWSPFALLSGKVNGHNYFKGSIADSLHPQKNLLELARLNEPVGASIEMLQAKEWYIDKTIYSPSSTCSKNVAVWNDKPTAQKVRVRIEATLPGGRTITLAKAKAVVPAFESVSIPTQFTIPDCTGVLYLRPVICQGLRKTKGAERRLMVCANGDDFLETLAFGGRKKPVPGCDSVIGNFIGHEVADSVQQKIFTYASGSLIDKIEQKKNGSYIMKASRYENPYHFFTATFTFAPDGSLLNKSEKETFKHNDALDVRAQ